MVQNSAARAGSSTSFPGSYSDETSAMRIQAMELDAVMGIGRSFVVPYLVLFLAFSLVMYDHAPRRWLLAWACGYVTFIALRTLSTWAYHRDPLRHAPGRIGRWRAAVTVSAAVHGVALGSMAVFALPALPVALQFTLMALVILLCASAALYVAPMLVPLNLLVVLALGPYVVMWSGFIDTALPIGWGLVGIVLVFVYLNIHHHRVLSHNFRLVIAGEAMAQELREKNLLLERSYSSRTQLIATVSHDLRQPVHTMGLLVAGLDPHAGPERLGPAIAQLELASTVMSEMLTELMDLSRLESPDYPVRMEAVELDLLLAQTRLNYEHAARAKGLGFEVARSGLRVHSDPRLLRRILFNLTGNAVRYTRNGEIQIRCRRDARQAVLTVADTGSGIPADRLASIFQDYVRAVEPSDAAQGLGLGLAIVRRACTLLGHTVSVESTPAGGTSFHVRMPLARSAPAAVPTDPAPAGASGRHTILVIENDTEALHAMCDLLRSWGHDCIAVTSGRELAAALAGAASPQAVVSDLHLDERGDGFMLIERARAITGRADLPAMLVTGDVSTSLSHRAAQERIALVHKPLAPHLLRERLDALLAGPDASYVCA